MGHTTTPDIVRKHAPWTDDTQPREPRMYHVIMLNDDYTPMDFVVEVLIQMFQKSPSEAEALMLRIHTQGHAVCGTYPRDIAESKAARVRAHAQHQGYPLDCSVTPES